MFPTTHEKIREIMAALSLATDSTRLKRLGWPTRTVRSEIDRCRVGQDRTER